MRDGRPNTTDVHVCTDCYFSHHYGATPVTEEEKYASQAARDAVRYGWADEGDPLWWVGESDAVTPLEPCNLLPDIRYVSDDTCGEHNPSEPDEDTGKVRPCDFCGREDGDGYTEFSSSRCDGCGSHLAGARYRLAVHNN